MKNFEFIVGLLAGATLILILEVFSVNSHEDPFLIGLIITAIFFWGLYRYVSKEEEKERKDILRSSKD